jgi:immunomodulating metalloprotease
MKNLHSPLLCVAALSLFLTACGGGANDVASNSNSAGAAINSGTEPSAVRPATGATTTVEGTPMTDLVIDPITGQVTISPGTFTPPVITQPPGPVTINPVPKDALVEALATGNSSGVTADRIITELRAEAAKQIAAEKALNQATFGVKADGTSTSATASNINWDLGQDSVYFTPSFNERTAAILTSNWKYLAAPVASTSGRVLATAGEFPSSTARYAAFGNNPMAIRGDLAMDQFTKNTINWLAKRSDSTAPLKVVVAHLPGTATTWFKHEVPTRQWLAAQFPGSTINGVAATAAVDDSCDGTKLAGCLQNADLLIMGRQQGPNGGTSAVTNNYPSTYNGDTVLNAVKEAQGRGVPVMYVHHDGDNNDLSSKMFQYFGLTSNDNYFSHEGVKNLSAQSMPTAIKNTALLALLNRFDQTGAFSSTWSGCEKTTGLTSCDNDAAFINEFDQPTEAMKTTLRALDTNGVPLFSQEDYRIEKLQVLLGDKWREAVRYPLVKETSGKDFYKALFADASVYMNRGYSVTSSNQNNSFAPKAIAAETPAFSRLVSTASPQVGKKEYVTGLFVMPGRTVTLTRTDTNANVIKFGVNLLRNTTRVFDRYDRPSAIASPRVELKAAKPVTITSAHGGPLYLFIDSEASAAQVTVKVDGVITHPVLRDANDSAQVAAFKSELFSTPTNWAVIGTEFLTVHSTVGQFKTTLTNYAEDLPKLAADINNYVVKDTYELAGFNSASGQFTLSPAVIANCNAAGWDCTGLQHRRDVMQHVIVDTVALCGSACSGNPYDQSGPLNPLGWGETHEIGHNLQRDRLKIYDGRSGEVSNNIFPVHKQMVFNRATSPAVPLTRRDTSAELGFNVILTSLQPTARADHAYQAIWFDDSYAANNGLRVSFYRQLVEFARVHKTGATNGTNFTDGWELVTLLYLMERNFTNSSTNWSNVAVNMGFGTYTAYPKDISGNDFMLIGTSRIIGMDMRPIFDMWGVTYTTEASAQVAAYSFAPAQKWVFPMNNVNAFGAGVGAPILMTPTTPNSAYPIAFK